MDLGWCVSLMDLGCVRRMSCDGLEAEDADWI